MEREIIMLAKRSLLFHGCATWIKKDGSDFDVTMGSYDGAEVCELVGLYMLHLLLQRFGIDFVGLYKDDGSTAQILSKKQAVRAWKDIIAIFKSCGFTITVEINLPRMDMLDETFDLSSGKYWPYRKSNNEPLYIHSKSNHPPSILKHLPKNVNDRLSSISCDEAEFDKTKPAYEQALTNSGFNSTLTYTTPSQLQSSQSAKQKHQRKRNIMWFKPPFDKNVTSNIGRRFLELFDLHFYVGHPYHRIFNRNTVKVSYCCMPNMGSIISSHNHKVLKSEKRLSPHDVPATVINLKTALWKDTAWECNVLYIKQRSVPQIMPRNTTMVSLSQSSKVAMLITNRLSNTPAREILPSSPNTSGSCVIKVLMRRISKLIGVSSDKPINTSVAQGDATCVWPKSLW